MIKILINDVEYNPEWFCERCTMDSAIKACQEAQKGDVDYHKYYRDAECILRLVKGLCFHCKDETKAEYIHHMSDDYKSLVCDGHKPCQEVISESGRIEQLTKGHP